MKKMKGLKFILILIPILLVSLSVSLFHAKSVFDVFLSSASFYAHEFQTVVIDAGHGGVDGGAVSASGAIESQLNLTIAQRLDLIMGLYGVNTVMLRNSDISLHDPAALTIHEKKVSDLHNRVKIIESIYDPIVISIHQNTFPDKKYRGAQVFFANGELSLPLAQITQDALRNTLDPKNTRKPAAIPSSVYLMNHISCKAILVECGFLSNPEEDILLQSADYQTKLAAAIAGAYIQYQQTPKEGTITNVS